MKAHIAKSPIGYFAFDDDQNLLCYNLFKPSTGESLDRMRKKIDESFLKKLGSYDAVEDKFALKIIRKRMREYAISLGFCKNNSEFNDFMNEIGMKMSAEKLAGAIKKDMVLVQAANSLDSVNKLVNTLTEHFKEWFWLHYPEYKEENEKILEHVIKYGSRENFPSFRSSYGIEFNESDIGLIREFATQIISLYSLRNNMEKYVSGLAEEVSPNFSFLAGGLIAARMISIAGSLEKLSKMTSSTIQLLGAEKALFRHLKNRKSRPPKYGILYESAYVRNAPYEKKGKAARIVASYLSKAVKIDFYSGRDEKELLKKEMEKELKAVIR